MDFQVVTISVSDLTVSKQFYEGILGFKPGVLYEQWQGYKLETTGGFGIIEEPGLNRNPSKDIINFELDDVESFWNHVKKTSYSGIGTTKVAMGYVQVCSN